MEKTNSLHPEGLNNQQPRIENHPKIDERNLNTEFLARFFRFGSCFS
jgi:hypothetical protein